MNMNYDYLLFRAIRTFKFKGEVNSLSKSWQVEIIYNLCRIFLAKQLAITGCWQYSPILYLLNKYNLHNFLTPVSTCQHIVNNINVVAKEMSIRKRNVHQKKKYPSQLSVDRKKLQELSCNLMNIEKSQVNRYKLFLQ
jgi:hypothetical protein